MKSLKSMMKKTLTLFFLGLAVNFISTHSMAQKLTVFDESTLQPIENVKVFVEGEMNTILSTNGRGTVDLSVLQFTGPVFIQHPYYKVEKLSYEELRKRSFYVSLVEKVNDLDEVVVSASKFEEKKRDVVQKIQVIRASDLQNMNQTSTADVLQNAGGVMVQKSQLGGGSPIIRGFETNRVLIVVDGVRMNNAIYRGGHLQNVVTLDNSVMDRVELVFGPGSVVYGSDALGGVMHFYSKDPSFSSTDTVLVKANAFGRSMSAANGYAAHADISVANEKIGSLTSFTYSNFGDLRQGANRSSAYPDFGERPWSVQQINGLDSVVANPDPNIQLGSGYQQYDFTQKIVLKGEGVDQTVNLQHSTSTDVPRYDRLTQTKGGTARYAEWYYGPQDRTFLSYRVDAKGASKLFDNARIITAYQKIQESRVTRLFRDSLKSSRIEDLDIVSFNADFEKLLKRSELRYGAEAYANFVRSSAFSKNIKTNETAIIDTRYPDGGSKMTGLAAYFTQSWELGRKKRFILSDGVRFSQIDLEARFIDKSFFNFPYSVVSQSNPALNGHLGLVFNASQKDRSYINFSTGFRAPNVDDISKVFESTAGLVLVPNPKLKPEFAYNAEIGHSHTFAERLTVSGIVYGTLLENALSVQPEQFNGQDSIFYDGAMSAVATTTNNGRAYVYGFEGGLSGDLFEHISVNSSINYTYGRISSAAGFAGVGDSADSPLDHIPPLFGRASVVYKQKKMRAEFFTQFAGWKYTKDYNISGEDNFANATPEGMPSWYTLNLRLNYQFKKWIGMQVACENILDQNYRVFASNISSPGRNFIVTLRTNL
jgi:hemoglobin/transferrin/lactoferrin receptor protein